MKKKTKERFIGLGYALFGAFAYFTGAAKGLILMPIGLILIFSKINLLFDEDPTQDSLFVLKGKRNDKRKTNDEKLRKMQNQEVTGKVYGADI